MVVVGVVRGNVLICTPSAANTLEYHYLALTSSRYANTSSFTWYFLA